MKKPKLTWGNTLIIVTHIRIPTFLHHNKLYNNDKIIQFCIKEFMKCYDCSKFVLDKGKIKVNNINYLECDMFVKTLVYNGYIGNVIIKYQQNNE